MFLARIRRSKRCNLGLDVVKNCHSGRDALRSADESGPLDKKSSCTAGQSPESLSTLLDKDWDAII